MRIQKRILESDLLYRGSCFVNRLRKILRLLWDILNIGIIGLNSFLILLYRYGDSYKMKYVICFACVAYIVVFCIQAVVLKSTPDKRQRTVYQTRRIFRLIYTALYLTVIMLEVLAVTSQPTTETNRQLAYYGVMFLWTGMWGTNFLWLRKAGRKVKDTMSHVCSETKYNVGENRKGDPETRS